MCKRRGRLLTRPEVEPTAEWLRKPGIGRRLVDGHDVSGITIEHTVIDAPGSPTRARRLAAIELMAARGAGFTVEHVRAAQRYTELWLRAERSFGPTGSSLDGGRAAEYHPAAAVPAGLARIAAAKDLERIREALRANNVLAAVQALCERDLTAAEWAREGGFCQRRARRMMRRGVEALAYIWPA